jgi:predicted secreted protein
MMFSAIRNFGFACLVIVLAGGHAFADDVVATAADSGKTISIHVGQVLTVNLTGVRGSGKYWRINADLTPELTLSGRSVSGLEVPGAPETTSYSFKTNGPGTLVFKASYLVPGAPIPKTNDVEFTLTVLP